MNDNILGRTRKILVTGSIPTENLPEKKHDVSQPKRRTLVRKNVGDMPSASSSTSPASSTSTTPALTSLECLVKRLNKKSIHPWQVDKSGESEVKMNFHDDVHSIPKYTVVVDSALEFTVFLYQWPIPDEHNLYKQSKRSIRNTDNNELLSSIENSSLCEGLPDDDEVISMAADPTRSPINTPERAQFEVSVFYRSLNCEVIVENASPKLQSCKPCSHSTSTIKKAARKRGKVSATPAKSKAPLVACGPEKLRATVRSTSSNVSSWRTSCISLKRKLKKMECVSEYLEKDLLTIMGGQNLEATPHMKFFWEQQMKLLQSKKMGRRYHPQIIRFALSLHGKSPSAYRELRDSGALILPSERVLRDYKNYFKPKAGINKENVESLREKTTSFSNVQRYVVLVMDEMKIQSNLVFDKFSGNLIGFVDLGDPMTNFANLAEEDHVASHALAFLVRGFWTDLKHVIAYFFTGNATSFQLMPLFWRIVSVLEMSLNLWVCAAVNDGASPNRKFFRLHSHLAADVKFDVVYKTPNVFAMSRFIYFFADSPHLMKTARNCLYDSGYGSSSRYMWNDDNHLLFRHIADLFYGDQEFGLHTLPKYHIVLTSYSKMKVKLATQVLSKSVAISLRESGKKEVLGTAQFCEMMNDFFDCTNVRSKTEHIRKRNQFIKPYTSGNDERFTWLKDVFMKYIH